MTRLNEARTHFVTVSTQRSGSTWLTDLLNSHPDIASYTELFLRKGEGTPDWGKYKDQVYWQTYRRGLRGIERLIRPVGVFRYLDEVFAAHPEKRAIGLKLMYSQIVQWPETLWYIRRRRLRIIHLIRRNVLDIVLSSMAKKARKVAHAEQGGEFQRVKLHVDPKLLLQQLRRRERDQRLFGIVLGRLGVPVFSVVYEDIAADEGGLGNCLEFLGCPPRSLASRMEKLNPANHDELIENCGDIEAALTGTPYRTMLRTGEG
ncbi:sulfotransferase domain-containing protein [Thiohalobacter sp. IOR34]|uniref:sulfotransferase domain-containing protein n=1 Tax=Thiohalobacter sp. IOR34 TaxID=3057176 RepID=UPI0025B16291|nr:sulfotransferase domain-containing protein [Thiohalobacter sp. IOR34]WJW75306.1 sulfotransferase domain-containing protein [Thiohalobacter sp. IOR34]